MPQTAEQILQQEFLIARSKILELAAILDRLERASGDVSTHPQMTLLHRGLEILTSEPSQASRAEKMQLLFSREYKADWRKSMGV